MTAVVVMLVPGVIVPGMVACMGANGAAVIMPMPMFMILRMGRRMIVRVIVSMIMGRMRRVVRVAVAFVSVLVIMTMAVLSVTMVMGVIVRCVAMAVIVIVIAVIMIVAVIMVMPMG